MRWFFNNFYGIINHIYYYDLKYLFYVIQILYNLNLKIKLTMTETDHINEVEDVLEKPMIPRNYES